MLAMKARRTMILRYILHVFGLIHREPESPHDLNKLRKNRPPAMATIIGPEGRCVKAAIQLPRSVEASAAPIAIANIPSMLRATRFATTAGIMMSEPMSSTPR